MFIDILRWIIVLALAFIAGKLITKIKMPSILGWLLFGMLFGHYAIKLLPKSLLSASWYKNIIMCMQCAFGVMLGSELIWKKLKNSGKALIITTLTQSLGKFVIVSLAFGITFAFTNVPIYLAFGLSSNFRSWFVHIYIYISSCLWKILWCKNWCKNYTYAEYC